MQMILYMPDPFYCVQRHVGSLQLAVQKLEAEVSAGKRRDEALHTAAKTLREHKTALDLEAVRFKVRGAGALALA